MTHDSTQIIRDDRELRGITKEIGSNLQDSRKAVFPEKQALYGILANRSECLPVIRLRSSDFLYLGKTTTRTGRGHFKTGKTSSSTLRRTIGALLKEKLELSAYARGHGRNENDFAHYRFDESGEERLTEWMKAILLVGFSVVIDDVDQIEKRLISYCEPVLNLTGWTNPQAEKIKALRKTCADEARVNGPLWKQ